MKAIVLAAGRGRRLWPFTADCPKCLLSIGPFSILEQQLANLESAGVRQVVLVCGFGIERVRLAVAAYAGQRGHCIATDAPAAVAQGPEQGDRDEPLVPAGALTVKLLYNPFSAIADNLISLWAARSEMDQDFLLLNGDNVFHPELLALLQSSTDPCCLLAARKAVYDEDDMKLHLEGQRVLRIGKVLPGGRADAESVGIIKLAGPGVARLRQALEEFVQQERAVHSCFPDAIQHLIDQGHPVVVRDTGGLACADVDTPEDLRYVRQHLHLFRQDEAGLESRRWG